MWRGGLQIYKMWILVNKIMLVKCYLNVDRLEHTFGRDVAYKFHYLVLIKYNTIAFTKREKLDIAIVFIRALKNNKNI